MNFDKFLEWKKALLSRSGITIPDGRSLYLYRISEDEFIGLEELLRFWLEQLLPRYGLAKVANLPGFSELFVLYAAEWWRRRYDGSGFSWEPILRDLGANPDEWSPTQRSEFVKIGFRGWRITPRQTGGLRFIGTVAIQGGLPLKLLASSRGRIGQLLSRVLHLASGSQISQTDLQNWVESLASTLPQSYRQSTIFALLADVAWTVLRLKQEAGLTVSSNAIDVLNSHVSDWRDRFPLPVDDEHAQGMIEQLIRDAASVRIEKQALFLPVERVIESNDEGSWSIRSRLSLTDVLPIDKVATLFSTTVDDLPRVAELSLQVGHNTQSAALRRLAGHPSYRVERKPWGLSGVESTAEHILRLNAPDGRVWSVPANRGEELDAELPWVFIERNGSCQLVRQGSGSVSAQEALVALPADWILDATSIGDVEQVGFLACLDRGMFKVRGVMQAQHDLGMSFRLKTGRADASEESFIWGGERYWLDFISPNIAFKGMPSLYRVGENDIKRKVDGTPGISFLGGGASQTTAAFGPLKVRYPATGNIAYQGRVLVLPQRAGVEINPSDARSGSIRFIDWGLSAVRVLDDGVEQSQTSASGVLSLQLSVSGQQRAPGMVELEALWLCSTFPVRFRLPFPARGVRAFDGEGRELDDGSLVAARALAGVRLAVSGGQANSQVEMKILDHTGSNVRKFRLRTLPGALGLEVRLLDYAGEIEQLFSINDQVDARVSVQIRVQGALLFTLILARYSALLEREGDVIRLDWEGLKSQQLDGLADLSVLAVRLESPGDEAVHLIPCDSEGVATGTWKFDIQQRAPGSWLVHPASDSLVHFRPTLWFMDGDIGEVGQLAEAFAHAEPQMRAEAIDRVIVALADDFDHPDWLTIEQLASQLGHLPLPTLDVWRRFVHSPSAMASLAFRFNTLKPEFILRFAHELPFAWEAIAYHDWHRAISQLQNQCVGAFGEGHANNVLQPYLSGRIRLLVSVNGALAFLLGIAAVELLPDTRKEVEVLKFLGLHARQNLFEGEGSYLMALLRQHAEDEWPNELKSFWASVDVDESAMDFLYRGAQGFQAGVINLPLLLAIQSVTNQSLSWFSSAKRVHALRNYRAFDPDWFDEAYNQTVAHYFAHGLLGEEKE